MPGRDQFDVRCVARRSHDRGLAVFERYRFSLDDSIPVATALISGAKILYSEDLQHGQIIDNQLRVTNPF